MVEQYAVWTARENARARMIADSPVIITDADIEPRTTAFLNNQIPPVPAVDIHHTPQGAKKMAAFTAAHRGEVMGIFLDDRLLEAPVILGTISAEGEISGAFKTLADAQALAARLNGDTVTDAAYATAK